MVSFNGKFSEPGTVWVLWSRFDMPFSCFYKSGKKGGGGFIGIILMDLSKAYDCSLDALLIAKLEAYGRHSDSLNLLSDFVSFRKWRTKVGFYFNKWSKIRCGIPQSQYSRTCLKDHLSKATTHKSSQVIFDTIYTAQNDHLSNTTNDHFLTVASILPTRI